MSLQTPQAVEDRLAEIDKALANLQNSIEGTALAWYRCKRDREKDRAKAFLTAKGTDIARKELATESTADIGVEEEGKWEGQKAVLKTLESRAVVGTAILKAQGRS